MNHKNLGKYERTAAHRKATSKASKKDWSKKRRSEAMKAAWRAKRKSLKMKAFWKLAKQEGRAFGRWKGTSTPLLDAKEVAATSKLATMFPGKTFKTLTNEERRTYQRTLDKRYKTPLLSTGLRPKTEPVEVAQIDDGVIDKLALAISVRVEQIVEKKLLEIQAKAVTQFLFEHPEFIKP